MIVSQHDSEIYLYFLNANFQLKIASLTEYLEISRPIYWLNSDHFPRLRLQPEYVECTRMQYNNDTLSIICEQIGTASNQSYLGVCDVSNKYWPSCAS